MMSPTQHMLSEASMEYEIADAAFALLIEKATNGAERRRLKQQRDEALAGLKAEIDRCRDLARAS